MRVLVTGGAGFIGSVVVAQLLAGGQEVVVYDDLSKGNRRAVSAKAELIVGKLENLTHLSSVFQKYKFDAVMHFAASIEAGESMKTPTRYFRNNTANAMTLLGQVAEYGVSRFVFSSTAALYGNPLRSPILETDALQPTNVYGESKLLVERTLPWYHRIHGLSYASLRYFNAAGATAELGEMHVPETHLVPILLRVAAGQRDSVAIFGTDYETFDGTCIRDYVHVSDLASAHLLALDAITVLGSPKASIYNLGNGRGFSVRQVIEVARRVTGHAIPAIEEARRPGDPAILVASSDKIRLELGWKPQYTELGAIVSSAWNWFQRHPNGYVD
jgi:UDP-glucose 4-epimerase